MKVVLLGDEDTLSGRKRAGTVIDHPQADQLIKLGKAIAYVPKPQPPVVESTVAVEQATVPAPKPKPTSKKVIQNASGQAAPPSADRGADQTAVGPQGPTAS